MKMVDITKPKKLIYFGSKIDGLDVDYYFDINNERFGGD